MKNDRLKASVSARSRSTIEAVSPSMSPAMSSILREITSKKASPVTP